jgi:hypothetical protein
MFLASLEILADVLSSGAYWCALKVVTTSPSRLYSTEELRDTPGRFD